MSTFNIHTAKAHLSELIQKALLGEEVILAKDNRPLAKIVPLSSARPKRCIGLAKGLIKISPNFDEPMDDFEDYTK